MARLIKKEYNGPVEIKVDKARSIQICMCGLSNNQQTIFALISHSDLIDAQQNKTFMQPQGGGRLCKLILSIEVVFL